MELPYQRVDERRSTWAREVSVPHPIPPCSDPPTGSLSAWLETWLEKVVRPTVRPTTYLHYAYVVRVRVLPAIGDVPLGAVQPLHLQTVLADASAAGLAPRTVRQIARVVRIGLERAVRFGLIENNPGREVAVPPVPVDLPTTLRRTQVRRLIAAARGPRLAAALGMALGGALRIGELLGAQWGDIDLRTGLLQVRRNAQWIGRGPTILPPKTRSSVRTITLPDFARGALQRLDAITAVRSGEQFVFAARGGNPIHPVTLSKELHRACEEARLPRVTFHELRHTAASLLLESGVHFRVVMQLLGHSRVETTLELYGHIRPDQHREAAVALERLVGKRRTRRRASDT